MKFFRKGFFKYLAAFLAVNILFQTVSPTVSWALTSGPTQPELSSFEPVGTTQMVDLFSGDFNYNIPLMTVPGPNGGYPINLAYHAGIGLEQEASWVGLGWNINPGVINREMRGIPDDFNGDSIIKTTSMKPQRTYSLYGGTAFSTEIFGWAVSANYQAFWNNYKGMGSHISLEMATKESMRSHFSKGLSLSYSNDGGLGVSPTLSYHDTEGGRQRRYHLGLDFNSKEGMSGVHMKYDKKQIAQFEGSSGAATKNIAYAMKGRFGQGSGVSFSGGSFVPNVTNSMTGLQMRFGVKWGYSTTLGDYDYKWLGAAYSQNQLTDNADTVKTYGYDYQHNAIPGSNAIMDLNREKDVPVIKHSPRLPVPQNTYDVYYVKGQGIGSVFRPYRSDFGIISDNGVSSGSRGGNLQIELGSGSSPVFGADVGLNHSESSSGMWSDPKFYAPFMSSGTPSYNKMLFVKHGVNTSSGDNSAGLYEPFYFKATGELTTQENTSWIPGGENAIRFNLGLKFKGKSFKPKIKDASNIVPTTNTVSPNRERRNQSIQKKFNWEISRGAPYYHGAPGSTPNYATHLYSLNTFPGRTGVNGTVFDYSFNTSTAHTYNSSERRNNHIGELSVINPDGNRYTYGIPVYNLKQKEASFSIGGGTQAGLSNQSLGNKLVTYTGGTDNSTSNSQGEDNYFSSNEMPSYVHSYLLTVITSPDYVDLTGNGPSEDDLGYYAKFNYSKTNSSSTSYKWRAPYKDAHSSKGYLSHIKDDKASYTYGEKEIYILNSIETKTHIAIFTVSAAYDGVNTHGRRDGFGVVTENNAYTASTYPNSDINSQYSYYLKQIDLYSKSDPLYISNSSSQKSIKSVHFEYNWDLCGSVDNNVGTAFSNALTGWSTTSSNPSTPTNLNSQKGKLTLKKVWFSYLGNKTGQLSPYVFDYKENVAVQNFQDENPNYGSTQMDRWGNYKPDDYTSGVSNEDNPYVDQSADYDHNGTIDDGFFNASTSDLDKRHKHSSAWTLKKISLPSGGEINITYEQDDYQYIQDKRAQQMFRIVGVDGGAGNYYNSKMNGKYPTEALYNSNEGGVLYFEFDKPVSAADAPAVMSKMLSGLDQVYFKAFMQLKKVPSTSYEAYDYVQGYARLDMSGSFSTANLSSQSTRPVQGNWGVLTDAPSVTVSSVAYYKVGYISLKPEKMHDLTGLEKINPIRKAAWQYMRMQRPDLFDQPTTGAGIVQDLVPVLQIIKDAAQFLQNYYNKCLTSNYANKIIAYGACPSLSHDVLPSYYKPSFIRLNSGYNKYGGGNRVKSITVNDNWSTMATGESSFSYGQEFIYQLPDGTSSGVASYEPMVGGDEIALRLPVKYSSDRFLSRDNALYTEEPYCESYFPAPTVGYSRVIVRDLKRMSGSTEINQLTTTGYAVSEFYTAKDFPVRVEMTDMDNKKYPLAIQIPFVGSFSFNNRGYSMGYMIELNDMHGKAKSIASYSSKASLFTTGNTILSAPISRVDYVYHTNSSYPNRLSNTVDVLHQDGYVASATVGRSMDFFVDMRESKDLSRDHARTFDITGVPPYPIIGWMIPITTYGEAMFRSVATVKVISRNGILKETRAYDDGSLVLTKNLMYDAQTGAPLLTQVTNEYKNVVYNYSLPAFWAYDNMGPSSKNVGSKFFAYSIASGGILTVTGITDLNDVFTVGDKVMIVDNTVTSANMEYWVTNIDALGANLTLKDEGGSAPGVVSVAGNNQKYITVVESGRKNLQTVMAGGITALEDPTTNTNNRSFPLFTLYNAMGVQSGPFSLNPYNSCDGKHSGLTINVSLNGRELTFSSTAGTAKVVFPSSESPTYATLDNYEFYYAGNKVKIVKTTPAATLVGKWIDASNAYPMCLDNILNASAVQFKSEWVYNYPDIGNPDAKYFVGPNWSSTTLQTATGYNAYRFGANNIWRSLRTNTYLVNRNQTTSTDLNPHTDPARDGTYLNFNMFNWDASTTGNEKWTYVNEVTAYNPYGFEIENKDALGNFSSALYGYQNTSVTAVASNASYFETAFDGFEDHGGAPTYVSGRGHWGFTHSSGTVPMLSTTSAHTGELVVNMGSATTLSASGTIGTSNPTTFTPLASKKYVITAWFKATSGTPQISVSGTGVNTSLTTSVIDPFKIEGWQRVEVTFTTQASGTVNFSLGFGSGAGYIDDVRIQPFNSSMKTFVYDPIKLWLLAEHDERGYSTFYNYDEEGTLVQVKKETVNGIMTLRTTRQNVKQ